MRQNNNRNQSFPGHGPCCFNLKAFTTYAHPENVLKSRVACFAFRFHAFNNFFPLWPFLILLELIWFFFPSRWENRMCTFLNWSQSTDGESFNEFQVKSPKSIKSPWNTEIKNFVYKNFESGPCFYKAPSNSSFNSLVICQKSKKQHT